MAGLQNAALWGGKAATRTESTLSWCHCAGRWTETPPTSPTGEGTMLRAEILTLSPLGKAPSHVFLLFFKLTALLRHSSGTIHFLHAILHSFNMPVVGHPVHLTFICAKQICMDGGFKIRP